MPLDRATSETDWEILLADRIGTWRHAVSEYSPQQLKATIDFETRSTVSLKKHGGYKYSRHPTTEAMCLSYKLPGEAFVRRWHMAHPQHLIAETSPPMELFAFILAGGLVEAHNAFFEQVIWLHVMVDRYRWPKVPPEQWRCSAAKASAASLPRSLENAVLAMGLSVEKDMVGNRLMKKMCKPRKLRKAEVEAWCQETGWYDDHGRAPGKDHPDLPIVWHEEEEDLYRLWDYCDTDVLSEEALSIAVPDLSPDELAVWQMDQAVNWRGAKFDLDLARAALEMAGQWRERLNSELETMTSVSSATKRAAVKTWLAEYENLDIPDTKAETLEWYIENENISGRARRIMEITTDVNRTSTRKYQAMLDKACADDWRIRDLLMYHGAGTGRWSGKGVQVHNFPARNLIVKDFEEACEAIKSRNLDWCVALFGDVMKLLSHALRGAIIADDGKDLIVADYSAIEARCVLWEAYANTALDIFRSGGDIYCDMATGIYGFEVSKSIAKDWKHPDYSLHSKCRQFGKQAILGLGYGMGFLTFLLTCRKYGITFSREDVLKIVKRERLEKYEGWVRNYLCLDDPRPNMTAEQAKKYTNRKRQAGRARRRLADVREDPKKIVHELALMKYTVDVYRDRYSEVKQMWTDQEAAAIRAVREGGRVKCGRVVWEVLDGWLHCWLPSGRPIRYRDPEVKLVRTSWGEDKPALRYMSVNGVTRKWERTATYGGKIVENITQAIARDIMANAMMLAHEGDTYATTMSIHDELMCEVDENDGSLKEFEELMSSVPPWADGCPITAEANRYKRYRK